MALANLENAFEVVHWAPQAGLLITARSSPWSRSRKVMTADAGAARLVPQNPSVGSKQLLTRCLYLWLDLPCNSQQSANVGMPRPAVPG